MPCGELDLRVVRIELPVAQGKTPLAGRPCTSGGVSAAYATLPAIHD